MEAQEKSMKKIQTTLIILVFAQAAVGMAAGEARTTPAADFVQQFYDWYLPLLSNEARSGDPISLALKGKKSAFSPSLAAALRADLEAASKNPDEIVGLDYDPFLNSQDPCERYQVGRAVEKGEEATVEVYAICQGKKEKAPSILVSLSRRGGKWEFVDFGSASNPHELTKALRNLKKDRIKSGSR